ncbi:MAG: biotin/lipoyl-binding protein [Rhodospirillaceae bacterium]|nr:biotin/lipoyl-binding protein [Rhodospirillaceae bacterium]
MAKLDVDENLVRKLAALLAETGLTELEYESGGQRIRVTRNGGGPAAPSVAPAPAPEQPEPAEPSGPPPGAVLSPMVGTAYLAPEPGAAPFVKVGDRVSQGDTLLIIEAMKVMNPIPAPHDGTVSAVQVADGQPVEYGDVLVVIR